MEFCWYDIFLKNIKLVASGFLSTAFNAKVAHIAHMERQFDIYPIEVSKS